MSFDFPNIHIADGSPEGQNIQAVMQREHVAPEEALRLILREANVRAETPSADVKRRRGPRLPNLDIAAAESIIGMFADRPELDAAMDAIIANRTERYASPR